MDIEYLIQLLSNKLIILTNARIQAFSNGDLSTINSIDTEILGVQNTLSQLSLVQQITSAAVASNSSPADVISSGLSTIQNTPVVPDSPTAVLALYDISTYASDPLYQQKISDILSLMPDFITAADIDVYIGNEAIGSPLTGSIVLAAAQQYSIDVRLLMAILELESNFGTAGVAVSTLNPGNVGNTGSSSQTYNSWHDGVNAVAHWLSLHFMGNLSSTDSSATAPVVVPTPVFTQANIVPNSPVVSQTPTPTPSPTPVSSPTPTPTPSPSPSPTPTPTPTDTPTPTPTPSVSPTPTPSPTPSPTDTPSPTPTPSPSPSPTPTPTPTDIPTPSPSDAPSPTPTDTSSSTTPLSMGKPKRRRLIV